MYHEFCVIAQILPKCCLQPFKQRQEWMQQWIVSKYFIYYIIVIITQILQLVPCNAKAFPTMNVSIMAVSVDSTVTELLFLTWTRQTRTTCHVWTLTSFTSRHFALTQSQRLMWAHRRTAVLLSFQLWLTRQQMTSHCAPGWQMKLERPGSRHAEATGEASMIVSCVVSRSGLACWLDNACQPFWAHKC